MTFRRPHSIAPALVAAGLLAIDISAQAPRLSADAIARAIADFAASVAAETANDPLWTDARSGIDANLKEAQAASAVRRRWLALERLAQARQSFLATRFTVAHPAERKDLAAFEREWSKLGTTLGPAAPKPATLDGIRPAVVRALAEVAAPQVRINYDAGLEYGRNTQPEYGLYYVGVADAQRQFLTLAREVTLAGGDAPAPPRLRSVAEEIAAVQHDLLTLYQPPASVECHSEFIVASSALKEARQYDADALRHAALLRLLQGTQRTAMLRRRAAADTEAIVEQLAAFRVRLDDPRIDHSIGRLFVERAEAALETKTPVGANTAAAVVTDVLPLYFSAIAPARLAPTPRVAATPIATVTLVRWPFT